MAASNFLLKIDTITGESKADGADGSLDILSYSWGVSNAGSNSAGGGGGSGKASFADISFTKHVDKASASLALACATGAHIPKAVFSVRKAGGTQKEYLTITLEDIVISSYQHGASAGDDVNPIESFTINYAKIKKEYKVQDEKGSLTAGGEFAYDVKANKKV